MLQTGRSVIVAAMVLVLTGGMSAQQKAPGPRNSPESRQFDFWVGTWDLTWPKDGKGTNSVTFELDSAVIMEHFSGESSMPLRGMSVSVYNLRRKTWLQTWVDNQGGYLDFVGGFSEGSMILERTAVVQGKEILQRMVWKNISHNSFDWSWEQSADRGKTWQVNWPIHYSRRS